VLRHPMFREIIRQTAEFRERRARELKEAADD
jgi:hypothetical protein